MRLSRRLETIIERTKAWADRQKEEICVADVGTDHGFVPICLVERGIASLAVALDVRQGPLMRAREHVQEHGLEKQITLRLGDGLKPLHPGEADVVVMAGMGGELMLKILREGRHVRDSVRCWIFSPQSELALFRHGLEELGLAIRDEVMLEEDGKYYTVMTAEPGRMHYADECGYRYGELLIASQSLVLARYLDKEIRQLLHIRGQLLADSGDSARRRLEEVECELQQAEQVKKLFP